MKVIFAILINLLLCGCATPYQEVGLRGGYSNLDLGNNKHLVNFRGNGFTSHGTVQMYAIRRAKELCIERGKDYEIIDLSDSTNLVKLPDSTNCSGTVNNGNWNATCHNQTGTTISKHETQILVLCK